MKFSWSLMVILSLILICSLQFIVCQSQLSRNQQTVMEIGKDLEAHQRSPLNGLNIKAIRARFSRIWRRIIIMQTLRFVTRLLDGISTKSLEIHNK